MVHLTLLHGFVLSYLTDIQKAFYSVDHNILIGTLKTNS